MLSGDLNTTRRGANVSITFFLVVACLLFSSNIKWIEGLSILGGNQGPYGAHIPSLDDLGQLVDHVEDELIGHDASEVPDIMVSYNFLPSCCVKYYLCLNLEISVKMTL